MTLQQRVERLEAKATPEGMHTPTTLVDLLTLTDAERERLSCGSVANMPGTDETVKLLCKLTDLVCASGDGERVRRWE